MSNNKFWMYDVTQLFKSSDLLPNPKESLEAKLNSITRLTIFICAIISIYKPVIAITTLITVTVITTAIFSIYKKPLTENFQEIQDYNNKDSSTVSELDDQSNNYMSLLEFMNEYKTEIGYPSNSFKYKKGFSTTQKRFCNDEVSLDYGSDYVSINQSLAGSPLMKTTTPPIIVAPSHDLSVWKENDFVIHSNINKETNFDYLRAGYNGGFLPTKCSTCFTICNEKCKKIKNPKVFEIINSSTKMLPDLIRKLRKSNSSENDIQNMLDSRESIFKTNQLNETNKLKKTEYIKSKNSPRTDNIITQTIQPGVYQKSHVAEPIQSNIGISYTQEFVPTEINSTVDKIKYTQQNPDNLIITPTLVKEVIDQSVENIYDPRFNGYGTSYRSYVDKLTGRPQFYYDDIDSITMPNYITRSNVDTFPWANTYGPDKIMNSDTNNEYRQLANNAFHDSSIQFRTELQERLMRKRNAELWQRRVAPITTMKK